MIGHPEDPTTQGLKTIVEFVGVGDGEMQIFDRVTIEYDYLMTNTEITLSWYDVKTLSSPPFPMFKSGKLVPKPKPCSGDLVQFSPPPSKPPAPVVRFDRKGTPATAVSQWYDSGGGSWSWTPLTPVGNGRFKTIWPLDCMFCVT
jgi:hypothetical protein